MNCTTTSYYNRSTVSQDHHPLPRPNHILPVTGPTAAVLRCPHGHIAVSGNSTVRTSKSCAALRCTRRPSGGGRQTGPWNSIASHIRNMVRSRLECFRVDDRTRKTSKKALSWGSHLHLEVGVIYCNHLVECHRCALSHESRGCLYRMPH